jgi:hypothetical protein
VEGKLEVLSAQVGSAAASMAGAAQPLITAPMAAKANALAVAAVVVTLAVSSQGLHFIIFSSIVTMVAAQPRASTPMMLS